MKLQSFLIPIVFALPLAAQTAEKAATPAAALDAGSTPALARVAILQFQDAVLSTAEGKQAVAGMKSKFDPRKAQLEKKQADLQAMQDKLQTGAATMDAAARTKLQNDLASGSRAMKHDVDDLNSEVQEEEGKLMQTISGKMGEMIKDYAAKNSYAVVLDVSSEQTPVIWASPAANITDDIVKLYDKAHPVNAAVPAKKP